MFFDKNFFNNPPKNKVYEDAVMCLKVAYFEKYALKFKYIASSTDKIMYSTHIVPDQLLQVITSTKVDIVQVMMSFWMWVIFCLSATRLSLYRSVR